MSMTTSEFAGLLSIVPNIRFFRYKVTFQLIPNTTTDGRTRSSDS